MELKIKCIAIRPLKLRQIHWLVWLLSLNLLLCRATAWAIQLCDLETGQTNIILDIEESRGNSTNQRTTPTELPIYGDPYTEIALELNFPKGNQIFLLNGKSIELITPLDRDEDDRSHIIFQVTCTIRLSRRKRNIPLIVRVSDINDNAPIFQNTPYLIGVAESTPIGTTIFTQLLAKDIDAGVNGLVEYTIIEGSHNLTGDVTLTANDGFGVFSIPFPHQGQITLSKSLDYEKVQRYYLTVMATDRARNVSQRLSTTATVVVNVQDSDDLDPSFIYSGCVLIDGSCLNPEYTASVSIGVLQGVLSVHPERIQAIDMDSISSPIRYSFLKGKPSNFRDYFTIDEDTAILKHIKPLTTNSINEFEIFIKAEEISEQKRFTTAKLTIKVKKPDTSPPMINATAVVGFVDENSPIGTNVLDSNGKPIRLTITDDDLSGGDPKPEYIFESTTPSFIISKMGYLIVNEETLDRDPPNPGVYRFQLVAREAVSNAASPPLSVTVTLLDKNDNAPKFPNYDSISVKAGDNRRFVAYITATDNDEGENAVIRYAIRHVSNNGMHKFDINEKTGQIDAKGKLVSGEHYSITVQATDTGQLSSQTIVEVYVTPGPNLRPPKFTKSIYEAQISEGVEINSTVVQVHADDPENDTITYSIISGDDLRQFSIQDNGLVTVSRKLDREDLTRYQLIIRAEDSGALSSSTTLNIKVTDINDKNPEFDDQLMPYQFYVEEGKEMAFVGIVHAHDSDEGINALVTYYLPEDVPFQINASNGEIRTKIKLDFETKSTYKFMITAKDGATEPRIGTTMVTVNVNDIPDELPTFKETFIEVKVPENLPNYHLTTVRAHDPDTFKQITYTLREGRGDLFKVDTKTGEVKTIRNLDYEEDKSHELLIGTLENDGMAPGDYVRIIVIVEDRNDVAPVFTNILGPVTVNDDQAIGSEIAVVRANDGDGSYPGNAVRYEIVGRNKALAYFQIDTESAVIKIKELLNKDPDSEYQIDVRAYDLGEPQLSTITSLTIFVRHMTSDLLPNSTNNFAQEMNHLSVGQAEFVDIGFAMDGYKCSISEAIRVNSTIKFLEIANINNIQKSNMRLKCDITQGNDNETFVAILMKNSCVISLKRPLDYESIKQYELIVTLSSDKYLTNPMKSMTKINVNIFDENDNAPEFVIDSNLGPNAQNNTYYATTQPDAFIDTTVLQIKAIDKDSGDYGSIRYRIYDNATTTTTNNTMKASTYFVIAEDTGILKVQHSLKSIQNTPLIFFVDAIDNNGDINDEKTKRTTARIVINLLSDANRLALAFSDLPPKSLRHHSAALKQLLTEKSNGKIVMIEGFSNRQLLNKNGIMAEDPDATDVWFYIIDPKTEKLLDRNDAMIQMQFFRKSAQTDINYEASNIARATAQGIFSPIGIAAGDNTQIHKSKTPIIVKSDVFPFALIAIALIILIVGIFGIVYICISWSNYKHFKQRMRQYTAASINTAASNKNYDTMNTMMISSRPNSQHSDSQSQFKEYETQVLAMAVSTDDDLQLDFSSKNHTFNLDNVSYITHKKSGQNSPTHSVATTVGLSTVQRNLNNKPLGMNNLNCPHDSTLNRNMRYQSNAIASNAINDSLNIGSLTLGRIKPYRANSQYGYENSKSQNEQTYENNFNTLGRNNRISTIASTQLDTNRVMGSRLSFQDNIHDTSPSSFYYSRILDGQNHSRCNDNVTFGKRDYNDFNFMYLNGFDRNEAETTTEL